MFSWLERSVIYIRMQPNWLSVRFVTRQGKAMEYADISQATVQKNLKSGSIVKLLGVGDSTKTLPTDEMNGITRCNRFDHPQIVVDDLDLASETLKAFIRKTLKGRRPLRTPRIIMHPLGKAEDDLSKLEVQALLDLTSRIAGGHSEVYILTGRELTDEELFLTHPDGTVLSRKPSLVNWLKATYGII